MDEDTPPLSVDSQPQTTGNPAPNSQTPGHPSFRRYLAVHLPGERLLMDE